MTVRVAVTALSSGTVTNTATVSGDQSDPVAGNNTAQETTTVILDADSDGIADGTDNCVFDFNPQQIDTDGDDQGNACDIDDDNDGLLDGDDAFPLDPTESVDTDRDGMGDNADTDDDNDGVLDTDDAFPFNPAESVDTDGDGMGDKFEARFELNLNDPNDAALDADGDGASNLEEFERHRNPLVNEHAVIQGVHPLMFRR